VWPSPTTTAAPRSCTSAASSCFLEERSAGLAASTLGDIANRGQMGAGSLAQAPARLARAPPRDKLADVVVAAAASASTSVPSCTRLRRGLGRRRQTCIASVRSQSSYAEEKGRCAKRRCGRCRRPAGWKSAVRRDILPPGCARDGPPPVGQVGGAGRGPPSFLWDSGSIDAMKKKPTGSSDAINPDCPVGKKFSSSPTDKAMVGSVFVTRALCVGTDVT
jgi:hypothetical protein